MRRIKHILSAVVVLAVVGSAAPAFAAIATVGFTTGNNNASPDLSTLTLNRPTVSEGQLMVAQVMVEGLGPALVCPPEGWTSILRNSVGSDSVQHTFYKAAAANETDNPSYAFQLRNSNCASGSSVTGKGAVGGIIAYSGVDTSDPIVDSGAASGSATTFNAPSIPDVAGDPDVPAGSRVLRFCGNDKEFVITAPGLVYSVNRPSGTGNIKPSAAAADAEQAVDGSTGTVTCSNSNNGGNWVAQTIALRMSTAGPTDSDNDGVPDGDDLCPNTPADEVGDVDADGCSPSQLDDDNDLVTNDIDLCPDTPADEVGDVDADGCSPSQLDDDNDTIFNDVDNCLQVPNTDQNDHDSDAVGNACDTDFIVACANPTIVGTAAGERLVGTRGADIIEGLGGNDTILGGGGADIICGGEGDDIIKGGKKSDKLFGGDGVDRLKGGAKKDTLVGGADNDVLKGGAGKDTLDGSAGNDLLKGGAGSDSLDGGTETDVCKGGLGNNVLVNCP